MVGTSHNNFEQPPWCSRPRSVHFTSYLAPTEFKNPLRANNAKLKPLHMLFPLLPITAFNLHKLLGIPSPPYPPTHRHFSYKHTHTRTFSCMLLHKQRFFLTLTYAVDGWFWGILWKVTSLSLIFPSSRALSLSWSLVCVSECVYVVLGELMTSLLCWFQTPAELSTSLASSAYVN